MVINNAGHYDGGDNDDDIVADDDNDDDGDNDWRSPRGSNSLHRDLEFLMI